MAARLLVATFFLLLTPHPAAAQPVADIVEEEVQSLLQKTEFRAVSVAVFAHGREHQFHYGTLIDGTKPDERTLYEIGSLTKTYTGLLLAQAIVDGKAGLDDPVTNYLPAGQYPNLFHDGAPITLRQIATHTSGLPVNLNCTGETLSVQARFTCFKTYSDAVFFAKLAETQLLDTPGARYRYSNAGIRLLSHILQSVYGLSYPEMLARFVFPRSGEDATFFRMPEGSDFRLAQGRDGAGSPMPTASDYYFGAGALKATAGSMAKYLRLNITSSDPAVTLAHTLAAGNADGLGRALVWNTFNYSKPDKMLYHSGGTFGTSSWLALHPNQKIGMFLVSNVATPDAQAQLNQISNRIAARIAGE